MLPNRPPTVGDLQKENDLLKRKLERQGRTIDELNQQVRKLKEDVDEAEYDRDNAQAAMQSLQHSTPGLGNDVPDIVRLNAELTTCKSQLVELEAEQEAQQRTSHVDRAAVASGFNALYYARCAVADAALVEAEMFYALGNKRRSRGIFAKSPQTGFISPQSGSRTAFRQYAGQPSYHQTGFPRYNRQFGGTPDMHQSPRPSELDYSHFQFPGSSLQVSPAHVGQEGMGAQTLGPGTVQLDPYSRPKEADARIPTPESKVQTEEESPLPEQTLGPIRRKRPVLTREQYTKRARRRVESDEVMGAQDPTVSLPGAPLMSTPTDSTKLHESDKPPARTVPRIEAEMPRSPAGFSVKAAPPQDESDTTSVMSQPKASKGTGTGPVGPKDESTKPTYASATEKEPEKEPTSADLIAEAVAFNATQSTAHLPQGIREMIARIDAIRAKRERAYFLCNLPTNLKETVTAALPGSEKTIAQPASRSGSPESTSKAEQ
ncbi:MAG: hypothetical protein Q9211_005182 [Gyalolechia sp. 1 TL-2023]